MQKTCYKITYNLNLNKYNIYIYNAHTPNLIEVWAYTISAYNVDSYFFWLQAIQDYTKIVPNGRSLLKENVKRRFLPYDDTWFAYNDKRAYSISSTIEDVIQEALQRHASGLEFREYDAGPNIDSQMQSEGFNISIKTDWKNVCRPVIGLHIIMLTRIQKGTYY